MNEIDILRENKPKLYESRAALLSSSLGPTTHGEISNNFIARLSKSRQTQANLIRLVEIFKCPFQNHFPQRCTCLSTGPLYLFLYISEFQLYSPHWVLNFVARLRIWSHYSKGSKFGSKFQSQLPQVTSISCHTQSQISMSSSTTSPAINVSLNSLNV